MMRGELIDGVERHLATPATFEIPSADQKVRVKPGDFVKVGVIPNTPGPFEAERFWVIVTAIPAPGVYEGVVNNDLVMTEQHGMACDMPITFEARHILTVEGRHG